MSDLLGLGASGIRAYQTALGGDCSIPLAGYAESIGGGRLRLRALVASLDGTTIARAEDSAPASEAEALGIRIARAVLGSGGRAILDAIAGEEAAEAAAGRDDSSAIRTDGRGHD